MLHHLFRFVPIAEKIIPRKTSLPILTFICVHKNVMTATDLKTTAVMKIKDTVGLHKRLNSFIEEEGVDMKNWFSLIVITN